MEMEERIKRLESNNRLLAIGVFALVAVIAALVTAMVVKVMPDYEARLNAQANHYDLALGDLRSDIDAGQTQKVVRVSLFQVVDEDDNVLAILGGQSGIGGAVTTFDGNGNTLVALGASEIYGGWGGSISTYNSAGNVFVRIANTTEGDGTASTYDGKGSRMVALGATGVEGTGAISMFNGKGTPLVLIGGTDTGNGSLFTYNGNGNELVALNSVEDSNGTVSINDGKGTQLVLISSTKDGEGAIGTFNRAGEVKNKWP